MGLQSSDARKEISSIEPLGLGEFRSGAFGVASEGIGGGEAAALDRYTRQGVARFFEPHDRLVGVRLQQMYGTNEVAKRADAGITRAQANGLLHERDHLVDRPDVELAPTKTM